jgi:hypothetical protein
MLARLVLVLLAAAALPFAPAASAQKYQSGSNYICPNNSDTGLDCYLDAVVHLYTMCRHVKSIEIIEFGLPAAQEGVNGAKSEYCVDKQKQNITRPYQAALREVTPSKQAVDGMRGLHELWNAALAALKWRPGESDDDYKSRTSAVYASIDERVASIRQALAGAGSPASSSGRTVATSAPEKAAR